MLRTTLAAAAMGLVASSALADPVNLTRPSGPDTYFNRPGADMAAHDRALSECIALAHRTSQPQLYVGASFLSAMMAAAIETWSDYKAYGANAENCMVARGWRVVQIPAEEAEAIAKLPQPQQAAKLSDWVGLATPHGEVVRQWGNDAAVGSTRKFDRTALLAGGPGLSFSARDRSIDPKPVTDPDFGWRPFQGFAREIKPAAIAGVPSKDAVIVMWVKSNGLAGDTMMLSREGSDPDVSPRLADKAPDRIVAYDNPVWQGGGRWMAFDVPAGRWRVTALASANGTLELNFCLGAPSFEVKAGEVVLAGAFNLSAPDIGPDLALAPAKAWLGQSPAAARLAPAVYTNGARGLCGGEYIYALEFKGAPYEPGYSWGGAAGQAVATAGSSPPAAAGSPGTAASTSPAPAGAATPAPRPTAPTPTVPATAPAAAPVPAAS
jgi:hypothetical protein